MTGQLVVAALLATGCGTSCLAKIEATRSATVAHRCRNYPSVRDCPKADGLNEKYWRKAEQQCANSVGVGR